MEDANIMRAKGRVYGNSLYRFCNFPVNLKLFQNKKLEKAHWKMVIGGSSIGNSFMEFSRKRKEKTDGSLRAKWGQKKFLFADLLS